MHFTEAQIKSTCEQTIRAMTAKSKFIIRDARLLMYIFLNAPVVVYEAGCYTPFEFLLLRGYDNEKSLKQEMKELILTLQKNNICEDGMIKIHPSFSTTWLLRLKDYEFSLVPSNPNPNKNVKGDLAMKFTSEEVTKICEETLYEMIMKNSITECDARLIMYLIINLPIKCHSDKGTFTPLSYLTGRERWGYLPTDDSKDCTSEGILKIQIEHLIIQLRRDHIFVNGQLRVDPSLPTEWLNGLANFKLLFDNVAHVDKCIKISFTIKTSAKCNVIGQKLLLQQELDRLSNEHFNTLFDEDRSLIVGNKTESNGMNGTTTTIEVLPYS